MPLILLVIDDDKQHLRPVREILSGDQIQIHTAAGGTEGWELFKEKRPDAVLLDLVLPDADGMQLLVRMVEADPGVEVILMTGNYSTESAVQAIQKGASDYLNKPLDVLKLRERAGRLASAKQRRRRAEWLEQGVVETFTFEGIVGRSPLMLQVFDQICRIGPHFETVLVTGATGTGKELVARALHRFTRNPSKPLAVCNCSAIAETLVETELFGHVRGAFTGASTDRIGLFEFANGGTLFLDEIGELSLTAQAKLLRALQQKEVQRVGSPVMRSVDVRVVAATNRDLRKLVEEGRFRQDLFYRLSMIEISLPRLADRKEDLALLQRYFLDAFNQKFNRSIRGLTLRAKQILARHAWPGNIRELENVIGHSCMLATSDVIDTYDLPEYLREPARAAADEELVSLGTAQKRYAARVLQRVGGNKARAAEILGISRTTLYALLEHLS